jgi:hypothetical protein
LISSWLEVSILESAFCAAATMVFALPDAITVVIRAAARVCVWFIQESTVNSRCGVIFAD